MKTPLAEAFFTSIDEGLDHNVATHMGLSDYLEENGHPLGEFMRVELQLADVADPEGRASLASRRAVLLDQHLGEIVGQELAAFLREWKVAPKRLTFTHGRLTGMNLCETSLTSDGAAALAAAVRASPTTLRWLTSLNLRDNHIDDAGAAALATLTNLTSLGLGINLIGPQGVTALATLTNLTSLGLWDNGINDAGAAALAPLTNLTSLGLGENRIGDAGATALASLTNLTWLSLRTNAIGPQGATALATLTNLTSLDLWENDIGPQGATALASLTNLTSLDVGANNLSSSDVQAMRAAWRGTQPFDAVVRFSNSLS